MALSKENIELESGIVVPSAYIRIDTISGSKDSIAIVTNFYVDQSSFFESKPFFMTRQFNFTPSVDDGSANFIKQGYEYLKTLPEFEGSTDVLE